MTERIGSADPATRPPAQARSGLGDTASVRCAATLGPWKVEDGLDPNDLQRPWVQQVADPGLYVALACGSDLGSSLANARLIAAAPELYEALGRAAELIETAYGPSTADEFRETLAKVRQ